MLKVLDEDGNGNTKKVLDAVMWVKENRERYHIKILNISVGMLPGAGVEEQRKLLYAIDELWDAGIMVVAAAGNNGPKENTVTIPGISRKVLTVGSSDDDTYDRGRKVLKTGYSGRGPTACCIVKPENKNPPSALRTSSLI